MIVNSIKEWYSRRRQNPRATFKFRLDIVTRTQHGGFAMIDQNRVDARQIEIRNKMIPFGIDKE